MTTTKRLAATALTAALLAVPTVAVSSADAAQGKSWTTTRTWFGAKVQACKVSVRQGEAWRIYGRVVNGQQAKVGAGLTVLKGEKTTSSWRSGLVAKGKTSQVGSVLLPRNSSHRLEGTVYRAQMGDSGPEQASKIGRC